MENQDINETEIDENGQEIHYHMNYEQPTAKEQFVTTLVVGGAMALLAGAAYGAGSIGYAIVDKVSESNRKRRALKAAVKDNQIEPNQD